MAMRSMNVRFTEKQYEELRLTSLIEDQPMAEIVRKSVHRYTKDRTFALDRVKQAIAEARSLGPASQELALKVAEQAAQLDDSEGLGQVRAEQRRAKASRRNSRRRTTKAGAS